MILCRCGASMKEGYDECYSCHQETLRENNELCGCGKRKKAEKETCFQCALDEARHNGQLCPKCERGIIRDPQRHKECFECSKQNRHRTG